MSTVFLIQMTELFMSNTCTLLCTDQSGMTALHHAARFGHKEIVKYMLDNGLYGVLVY